jgi:hypothetical protein
VKTKVVHVSRQKYDVYIGRGKDPISGIEGKWGNPFIIGKDGTRKEVIQKYREWIVKQPELMASLGELKGKRLGCWCGNQACHGDVLVELVDVEIPVQEQPDLFS